MARRGWIAAALTVTGCLDHQAGNTVETENTITARRISVDSLLPSWNHPFFFSTVGTLRLDSSHVDFANTLSDGSDLSIETEQGKPIPFAIEYWDRSLKRGRLQVRLDTPLLWPGSHFLLRWGLRPKARTDSSGVWKGIGGSQLLLLTSVLVDDFEDTIAGSTLPNRAGWYTRQSVPAVTVSAPQYLPAGAGRPGKALHIAYRTPPNTYEWALTGIAIAPSFRSLRTMDSLVFWVRGSGKLSIALDKLVGPEGKAWTSMTLDSTAWKHVCITPSSFDGPSPVGNNIGWTAVRDSITNLTFLVNGGTDLWLDSIRFHGIDREDLQ